MIHADVLQGFLLLQSTRLQHYALDEMLAVAEMGCLDPEDANGYMRARPLDVGRYEPRHQIG